MCVLISLCAESNILSCFLLMDSLFSMGCTFPFFLTHLPALGV